MNDKAYPEYSELYVISDLHLGGETGMQIFCRGERLKKFLEWLRKQADELLEGKLALVLAGDVIDTLPYQRAKNSYISIDNAVGIFEKIIKSFEDVFDGLSNFVDGKKCELIIMTGNHDLELAMPEVQETLLRTIADQNFKDKQIRNATDASSARGRVRFYTQGTGFCCKVGEKKVYVTHGNETDKWNHVNYEALREKIHARNLGKAFDPKSWSPNEGTQLVVDIMNEIKQNHPFIDLLKPEIEVALKVLIALDPDAVKKYAGDLASLKAKSAMHSDNVLGKIDSSLHEDSKLLTALIEGLSQASLTSGIHPEDYLSANVDKFQKQGKRPEDLVSDDEAELGLPEFYADNIVYEVKQNISKYFGNNDLDWENDGKPKALCDALKDWIKNDHSFVLDDKDDGQHKHLLEQLQDDVYGGIDVIIAGHTHLPRWIKSGGRFNQPIYLNTGTWARIFGLKDEWLKDQSKFKPVYKALTAKTMDELDNSSKNLGAHKLILDVTVAAHMSTKSNLEPELVRIIDNGTAGPIPSNNNILEW